MDDTNPINTLVGRSMGGAFAGSVFGAAVQLIFFWDGPPPEGIKLPWQGALVGALLVGLIGALVGARQLPNWLRRIAIGFLAGFVVGSLVGAFVFAPIMTWNEIGSDNVSYEKVIAVYRQIGVAAGAIVGGAVGSAVGIGLAFNDLRHRLAIARLRKASTGQSEGSAG